MEVTLDVMDGDMLHILLFYIYSIYITVYISERVIGNTFNRWICSVTVR